MTPKKSVLECVDRKARDPNLEPTILLDPIAACYYAKFVVKGRWLEAEPVIARGLGKRFGDFNILDEDDRVQVGSYRVGPRPKGSDHVKAGNNLRLMVVYMRLVGCRIPEFEGVLKAERWKGNALQYCETIYRQTGELIDLDLPEVCSWMIGRLALGRSSKRMPRAERIRVCNELHKRMVLHSFACGDNRNVKNYFRDQKRSENHFLIMLSQQDENMTVGEVIKKMTDGV